MTELFFRYSVLLSRVQGKGIRCEFKKFSPLRAGLEPDRAKEEYRSSPEASVARAVALLEAEVRRFYEDIGRSSKFSPRKPTKVDFPKTRLDDMRWEVGQDVHSDELFWHLLRHLEWQKINIGIIGDLTRRSPLPR